MKLLNFFAASLRAPTATDPLLFTGPKEQSPQGFSQRHTSTKLNQTDDKRRIKIVEKSQEKFTPSPDQIIETILGKGAVEAVGDDMTRSLLLDIKARLVEIGIENGTNKERKEKMLKYLDMWSWFFSALYARTRDETAKSPEVVKIAMEGATALMQPEIDQNGREAATKMIETLKKRYDIK